jgi:hypothetical protein
MIVLATGAACRPEPRLRYYHAVTGDVAVRGAFTADAALSPGSVPYGAAWIGRKPRQLTLDVAFADGDITAVIPGSGPGPRPISTMHLFEEGQDAAAAFTCRPSCTGCDAVIAEFNDDVISGEFRCPGLRSCGELDAGEPPPPDGDPLCGGASSEIIDVTGRFRLDNASDRHIDY